MSQAEYVCPKCGKDDGFFAEIEILDAWMAADIEVHDGKPKLIEHGPVEDAYNTHVTGWGCNCGHRFRDLEKELRKVWHEWEPGQVAIAPDGFRAVVERVEGEHVWIVGWHEQFTYADLTKLDVRLPDPLERAA